MKDIDIKLPRVPNISTWNPDLPSRRHMVSLLPLVDDIDEPVVGGMKGKGGERFVRKATRCSQLPDKLAAGYIWQGGRGGYPKATPRESASPMSHKGSFTTPPRNGQGRIPPTPGRAALREPAKASTLALHTTNLLPFFPLS